MARTLGDLIAQLRQLKIWAGDPSYVTIAKRVNDAWQTTMPHPARTSKSTVADCFTIGRPRPGEDLLLAIVGVLKPDVAYVAQWRQALRIVRGTAEAASLVEVQDGLPDDLPEFTGRRAEVDRLTRFLDGGTTGGGERVAVIHGMAGVGKTQLAIRVGHQLCRSRAIDQVLLVDLRGFHPDPDHPPADPAAVLDAFLRLLGVRGHQIPHDIVGRAALYRARLRGRRALVVLDNAANAAQVRPLLPGHPPCLTLITSRRDLTDLDHAQRLRLGTLGHEEALDLLRRLAGADRISAEPDDSALIVELCGHLPLDLAITSVQIQKEAEWTLADHVTRLESLPRDEAIRPALATSYRSLSAPQRRLFRLLAVHPGGDFTPHAAAALTRSTLVDADDLLRQLLADNLLLRKTAGRYQFHDLVRAFAARMCRSEDSNADRRAAIGRLLEHYVYAAAAATAWLAPHDQTRRLGLPVPETPIPDLAGSESAIVWLDSERSNLIAAAVYAADHGWSSRTCQLSTILGRYLDTSAHHHNAEVLHSRALHTADPASKANALNHLGNVYWRLGRYEEALKHHRQSLAIAREICDQRGEARSLTNLGAAYSRLGRIEDALDVLRQALDSTRSIGERLGEAVAIGNLGTSRLLLGHTTEALGDFQQSLKICRDIGDRPGEALALSNIGDAYERLGQLSDALEHHQQSLAIARDVGYRASEPTMLCGLGKVYRRMGLFDDALNHCRQALRIAAETGDHRVEVDALNGIGETLRQQGSSAQALDHHRDALALARDHGYRHEQADAERGIGHALAAIGECETAHGHWQRALSLYNELRLPEADEVAAELAALESQRISDPGAVTDRR